ncbi:cryptochrome/photolyase family protein [Cohnella hashimotonis]|uniref:Deoxyribodipyrimidine photo-lyase n=1 Tax=Cohnella hashimotonis TaxID=2826895 RepID=A0ABT6TD69_9BACL|nr:deoxyribodipyrimidine photo-lyase [Cohnella hashimotonis]MDI4644782.1 deoxyribodipyrimidine photo-lyase [Cohnella hashimotonis]
MKLFIHRKDLRISDLPALDYMAAGGEPGMHALFLDPFLLRGERYREHSGAGFLRAAGRLERAYEKAGRKLNILYGEPAALLDRVLDARPDIREVIVHEDYTPYANKRDRELREAALARGAAFTALPDLSLAPMRDFHEWTGRQTPYKVFTPFYRQWRAFLAERYTTVYASEVSDLDTVAAPSLPDCGLPAHLKSVMEDRDGQAHEPERRLRSFLNGALSRYAEARDAYAQDGTSRLSASLNRGEISARRLYVAVGELGSIQSESWLRQLAWRDFYLYQSRMDPDYYHYERKFDLSGLDDRHFAAWRDARTGIPVIDAAMTHLNETGWMPNRLRMIAAMFLTKNLRCPFIYGERYFRLKLSDYDNALNRGGWLWASSLGFDAAPYFRIMNPVTQSKKFDPAGDYLRTWLPRASLDAAVPIHEPAPDAIVDLRQSRLDAIAAYKAIIQNAAREPDDD